MNLQKEFQEFKFSSEVSSGHDNQNLKTLVGGYKSILRKELQK